MNNYHTEVVYTQGVGIHTIFGMTRDYQFVDLQSKFETKLKEHILSLRDRGVLSEQVDDFVRTHNSRWSGDFLIPD